MLAYAENEQTLEDVTALPNKESASETGDPDANPNYSMSDYSYSDISDKCSSFEVNISALNGTIKSRFDHRQRKQEAEEQKKEKSRPIRTGN